MEKSLLNKFPLIKVDGETYMYDMESIKMASEEIKEKIDKGISFEGNVVMVSMALQQLSMKYGGKYTERFERVVAGVVNGTGKKLPFEFDV